MHVVMKYKKKKKKKCRCNSNESPLQMASGLNPLVAGGNTTMKNLAEEIPSDNL